MSTKINDDLSMKTVDDYLKELFHAAQVAEMNYQIYQIYNNQNDRPKYVDTLNHDLHFFSTSIHAHFIAMLMALCKIYDKEYGNNLNKLIKLLEKNNLIDDAVILRVKQDLVAQKEVISKIHMLRNNHFGHINLEVEHLFKKTSITTNNFRDLIRVTKECLNKILYAHQQTKVVWELNVKETTYRLLDVLKENFERQN